LTITVDGDAETAAAVAGHLAGWLRNDGAMVIEAAIRDEAQPPYDDDWDGDPDDVSDIMIVYDSWCSSDWRMNSTIDNVILVSPQLPLFQDAV
jgi:hypothetical protein